MISTMGRLLLLIFGFKWSHFDGQKVHIGRISISKNVDFFHHYFESIQKTENGEVLEVQ